MNAIELHNISKRFGAVQAVDGVSLEVGKGEMFGMIGPDGAGKTTIFRILTTLLLPDSGQARVNGLDTVSQYKRIRDQIGYMPGRFSLYQDLSVGENLDFFSSLFGVGIEENYDIIAPIYKQIEPFKKRRAGKLSGGMKQKLALCCALIHRPSVLFLDEPTTGVDAVSRSEFWEMLSMLKRKGITIFVSTPYMDEAYKCDRVALINNGRIMEIDAPQALVEGFDDPLYALRGENIYQLLLAARETAGIKSCYPFGESLHLTAAEGFEPEAALAGFRAKGLSDACITPIKAGIEDLFIKLMTVEDDK